jgi:hypothetical protein
MTTRSRGSPFTSVTPTPSAVLPETMRTRLMIASRYETPRKENVWLPGRFGAKKLPSEFPDASKKVNDVVLARSTSEKIAPKPRVRAAPPPPGSEKVTSTMLLPIAEKRRTGENASNTPAYDGSMFEKSVAFCSKPVPGVVKVAPRMVVKAVNGDAPGAVVVAPPPSQLISRRPLASGPGAFPLFGFPRSARN